jgi:hypothetical protein
MLTVWLPNASVPIGPCGVHRRISRHTVCRYIIAFAHSGDAR